MKATIHRTLAFKRPDGKATLFLAEWSGNVDSEGNTGELRRWEGLYLTDETLTEIGLKGNLDKPYMFSDGCTAQKDGKDMTVKDFKDMVLAACSMPERPEYFPSLMVRETAKRIGDEKDLLTFLQDDFPKGRIFATLT